MPSQSTTNHSPDLPFAVEDRRKRGFFILDNIIIDEYGAQLGPYGIAVYACLCRFANRDEQCWPSHLRIAKRTGMSKTQVRREIERLAQLELIMITPRYDPETKRHSSNLYTLLDVCAVSAHDTGSMPTQDIGISRRGTRTKHSKKDPGPKSKKKNYIPDEYADIIIH